MTVPALARILIVFIAMLLASRLGLHLGAALILGGVGLGFWGGHAAPAVLGHLGHALTRSELWLFLVITGLIVEFGRYATEPRNADAIVSAIRRWGGRHGRAASLMAVPTVIGLIPMPAGALFSAPFVEQASAGVSQPPDWKSAVNYWFRHTLEYWWPLYPGIIVAMSVFGMETWRFIAGQLIFTPVALGAGYFFLIRPHLSLLASDRAQPAGASPRRITFVVMPLALVVSSAILLPFAFRALVPAMDGQLRRMVSMVIGLAAGMALIVWDERAEPRKRAFREMFRRKSLGVQFTVAGVLIFKSMLDSSGLLPLASRELLAWGIPIVCAVAVLPLLAGFVTGLGMGFTGTSFPLVVGLMNASGGALTPSATLALAYAFGYTGMILSPIHLCLVVTRDYFAASIGRIYARVLPPMAAVLASGIVVYNLYHALGW